MNSKDYWEQRELEQRKHNITEEAEYDKEIRRIFTDMLDGAQREIDAFYGKYARSENITIAEAKRRVSSMDIEAYERKAKRIVKDRDFSKEANEEMRLFNATMKINRLEMLKANIGLELIQGHDELDKFMGDILQGRTMEELERQAGILGKTIKDNAKLAHAIVNGSFHNATFSNRIWQNHDLMKADLSKLLQTGLIQGKNPRALASELRKYYIGEPYLKNGKKGATYAMERLMRTELARVQTEAQRQSFIANGFEMYTFHALGDCCGICRPLDGKHFKVKDMQFGLNAPPIHPHCRCSTSAYEDSDEYETWLDYLDKGHTTTEWNALDELARKQLIDDYKAKNAPKTEGVNRELPDIEFDLDVKGMKNAGESTTLKQLGKDRYEVTIGKGEKIEWDDISPDAKAQIGWKVPKRVGEAFTIPKGTYDVQPFVKGYPERTRRDEIAKAMGAKYVGSAYIKKYGTYFWTDFYDKNGSIMLSLGEAKLTKKPTKSTIQRIAQVVVEREKAIIERLKQGGRRIAQVTEREGNEWVDSMKVFHRSVGADGKPKIVSADEYDALESPTLYRGIAPQSTLRRDIKTTLTTQQMADGFFTDEMPFPSRGIYGDGIAYCSPSKDKIGAQYASSGGTITRGGKIIEFKLSPDAKTITYEDSVVLFEAMQGETQSSILFSKNQRKTQHEVGKAMNALGYDVIIKDNGDNTGIPFYVVLNRGAIIAKEDWTAETITPEYLKWVRRKW